MSASVLSLLAARSHAESSFTFKNQSWQEDDKRIRVDAQYALLDAEPTSEARLKVMGLIDTIAGAMTTHAARKRDHATLEPCARQTSDGVGRNSPAV